MKLYEQFGQSGYHTCLVTSFGIDFDAYESVVLGRLRGAGCNNNLLVVDRGMLSLALEEVSQLPREAGRTYTVTAAKTQGVFHPKIVLQLGRDGGRLIVGSANMTSAGLAGNLEVVGHVDAKAPDTAEAQIIASAWAFVLGFIDRNDEGIDAQVRWMLARSPWLSKIEPAATPLRLSDGHHAAFVGSGGNPIGGRFEALVGNRKVRRLIVVSPYWDNDLSALNRLIENLKPASAFVLLDCERHIFHPAAIAKAHRSKVNLIAFVGRKNKFVHAKLVIAETSDGDFVLYGSANCTTAALGRANTGGINAEACLYRSLPAGTAVDVLGLASFLDDDPINHDDYPVVEPLPELPLDAIDARYPGQFSCKFDKLTWAPPSNVDLGTDRIELLGSDGAPLSIEMRRLASGDTRRVQFTLIGNARPAFARVRRTNGTVSAMAIVTILDELRGAMKDPRSRQTDAALAKLDGEADMGLWLLDVLGELEAALTNQQRSTAPRTVAKVRASETEVIAAKILTYEEFMAGRRLRSESDGAGRDGLVGTEFSSFRGYLNRFLSIGEPPEPDLNSDDAGAFDLGDETADAEGALEAGYEFGGTMPGAAPAAKAPDREHDAQIAMRRRGTRDEVVDAVDKLLALVDRKAHDEGLNAVDLLRLRAYLMILATVGWRDAQLPTSSVHVLSATGDNGTTWPVLMGKILFAYFGKTSPAIRTLKLDGFFDQLPDDILECWATCMWAVQVAAESMTRLRQAGLAKYLSALATSLYQIVLLPRDDMSDPRVLRIMDALSERFARNLSPPADKIRAMHAATTAAVFALEQAAAGSELHERHQSPKIAAVSSIGSGRQY